MDRRTALALALALVVFAAFTALQARYGPTPVRKPAADTTLVVRDSAAAASDTTIATVPGAPALAPAAAAPAVPVVPEKLTVVETPLYRAEFSNRGARLVGIELKRFAAAYGESNFQAKPARRPKPGQEVPAGDRVHLDGGPTFALDLGSGASHRSLESTVFAVSEVGVFHCAKTVAPVGADCVRRIPVWGAAV